MKVICRKIISPGTGENMGESSPWLKVGNEYIVLALNCVEGSGLQIYIQTEHYNEPCFTHVEGFEFINQNIPTSWIAVVSEAYDRKVMLMLPASWNYDDFFEEINDQNPRAMELFAKEAEQIYREEGY